MSVQFRHIYQCLASISVSVCSRCVKPNLCLTAIIRRSFPCTPCANRPAFVSVGVAALARGSHVRRRRARSGEDKSRYDCLALDDCSGWCARSVEHGQRPSAVDRTDRSRSHCLDCLVPLGRYSLASCRSFIDFADKIDLVPRTGREHRFRVPSKISEEVFNRRLANGATIAGFRCRVSTGLSPSPVHRRHPAARRATGLARQPSALSSPAVRNPRGNGRCSSRRRCARWSDRVRTG